MFSSPAMQLYSSENAANTLQRKPGFGLETRRPFIDKPINSESPLDERKINCNNDLNFKEKIFPSFEKEDLKENSDLDDYAFSFKDEEDLFNDIVSLPKLGVEGILKILRDYTNSRPTPPPSPCQSIDEIPGFVDLDFDLLELPYEERPTELELLDIDIPDIKPFEDESFDSQTL